MNSALLPVFLVLGLGLVALVAFLSYYLEKKRRDLLSAAATARGWSFVERDDRWCDAFAGSPFGLGHNRQARNILQGLHDGRPFVGFDYVYHTTETSTGPNGTHSSREVSHWFSVLALQTVPGLPALEVSPEGFLTRTIGRLLNKDIELESEDFNRAFTVTCPDRKFAFDILHPRLMEYLLTSARDVAWKLSNGYVLTVESDRHDVAEIDRRLAVVDHVLDTVPDFVRQQYGMPGHQENA